MKCRAAFSSLLAALAVLLVAPSFAADAETKHPAVSSGPPAFEHLKSLVGTWEGVGEWKDRGTTSFEIVANGSAIMERLAPLEGSPMINVYHPDGDAVVMTHYCGAGNQPRLRCTKDGSSLVFTMSDITNWKKGDMKMSALNLVLVDADHITQEWISDDDGKKETMTITFARKK